MREKMFRRKKKSPIIIRPFQKLKAYLQPYWVEYKQLYWHWGTTPVGSCADRFMWWDGPRKYIYTRERWAGWARKLGGPIIVVWLCTRDVKAQPMHWLMKKYNGFFIPWRDWAVFCSSKQGQWIKHFWDHYSFGFVRNTFVELFWHVLGFGCELGSYVPSFLRIPVLGVGFAILILIPLYGQVKRWPVFRFWPLPRLWGEVTGWYSPAWCRHKYPLEKYLFTIDHEQYWEFVALREADEKEVWIFNRELYDDDEYREAWRWYKSMEALKLSPWLPLYPIIRFYLFPAVLFCFPFFFLRSLDRRTFRLWYWGRLGIRIVLYRVIKFFSPFLDDFVWAFYEYLHEQRVLWGDVFFYVTPYDFQEMMYMWDENRGDKITEWEDDLEESIDENPYLPHNMARTRFFQWGFNWYHHQYGVMGKNHVPLDKFGLYISKFIRWRGFRLWGWNTLLGSAATSFWGLVVLIIRTQFEVWFHRWVVSPVLLPLFEQVIRPFFVLVVRPLLGKWREWRSSRRLAKFQRRKRRIEVSRERRRVVMLYLWRGIHPYKDLEKPNRLGPLAYLLKLCAVGFSSVIPFVGVVFRRVYAVVNYHYNKYIVAPILYNKQKYIIREFPKPLYRWQLHYFRYLLWIVSYYPITITIIVTILAFSPVVYDWIHFNYPAYKTFWPWFIVAVLIVWMVGWLSSSIRRWGWWDWNFQMIMIALPGIALTSATNKRPRLASRSRRSKVLVKRILPKKFFGQLRDYFWYPFMEWIVVYPFSLFILTINVHGGFFYLVGEIVWVADILVYPFRALNWKDEWNVFVYHYLGDVFGLWVDYMRRVGLIDLFEYFFERFIKPFKPFFTFETPEVVKVAQQFYYYEVKPKSIFIFNFVHEWSLYFWSTYYYWYWRSDNLWRLKWDQFLIANMSVTVREFLEWAAVSNSYPLPFREKYVPYPPIDPWKQGKIVDFYYWKDINYWKPTYYTQMYTEGEVQLRHKTFFRGRPYISLGYDFSDKNPFDWYAIQQEEWRKGVYTWVAHELSFYKGPIWRWYSNKDYWFYWDPKNPYFNYEFYDRESRNYFGNNFGSMMARDLFPGHREDIPAICDFDVYGKLKYAKPGYAADISTDDHSRVVKFKKPGYAADISTDDHRRVVKFKKKKIT